MLSAAPVTVSGWEEYPRGKQRDGTGSQYLEKKGGLKEQEAPRYVTNVAVPASDNALASNLRWGKNLWGLIFLELNLD